MATRSFSLFPLVIALGSLLTGCGLGPDEDVDALSDSDSYEIVIGPSQANCTGVDERLCLQAEIDGEQSHFYDAIEGFSYQWCQRHTLLIREEAVPNPPADGSSIRYVLDEVIEATEVPGHEVTLTLYDDWANEDEISALDFDLRCAEGESALCEDLLAALNDGGIGQLRATFLCEEGEVAPRLVSFVQPVN